MNYVKLGAILAVCVLQCPLAFAGQEASSESGGVPFQTSIGTNQKQQVKAGHKQTGKQSAATHIHTARVTTTTTHHRN